MNLLKILSRTKNAQSKCSPASKAAKTKADERACDRYVRTRTDNRYSCRMLDPPMVEYRRNTVQFDPPGDHTDYGIFLASNRFRLDDALAIFEHKASDYCDHETFIWRGMIKNMLCRRDAIVDIERGLSLSPQNVLGRLAKVCHRTRLDLFIDNSTDETLQIIAEEPENQFAAVLFAVLQSWWCPEPLKKAAFFEEVLKKFPKNDYAMTALAILFCNSKCGERAKDYALRALALRPGNLSAAGVLRRLDVKNRSAATNPWDNRKNLGWTIDELLLEPLWSHDNI